ncbi:MAG: YqgE/AlgH family protein [Steroidobacteraceae bacterium]|nr:YqgE/AlgH family protein [Pseudomonadota bacterium]MBP7609474.1 YqgE/AlgH family protein [Steroidobacteraceae bacterium]MBP9129405.1 YqgE/AlgH family protein [Steroidobacteraceae bacterium]
MPAMDDPNFAQTVTLVCEHSERGALGIVINRTLPMTLGEVFQQLDLDCSRSRVSDQPVLRGGPVQTERGFVLHSPAGNYESSLPFSERMHLTTSRDILDALAAGEGPGNAVIALGYAGWEAGQLEDEMARNAWLSVDADERVLFATPIEQRWSAAARLLGVDLLSLSSDAGHA